MTRSGKFVTEHALCFSEIGRIDIEVLMTHWQGKEYHLLETLPIERGCFLKALVGTRQLPDTEMAVEVELEGSSTCSKEAVSLARGRGHPLQEQRVEGDFERTHVGKLQGEKIYSGGISSRFSKLSRSISTAASVCDPTRKLDDAVNSSKGPKVSDEEGNSFKGPKVDYPFRESTSNNSNLMFHINDFYGSSWDSRELEVTYASSSSGLNELLENKKRKALGQIDSIFD